MKNCTGHVLRMLFLAAALTASTSIVRAQAPDLPDSSLEFPKDSMSAGSIDSTNIVTISRSGDIPTADGRAYKNDFGKYHLSLGLGFYQSISNDVKNWDYYSSSYSQSHGVIEYVSVRRTITNIIDLVLDARAWQSKATVSGYYDNKIHVDNIGLGVRLTDCQKGAFWPYIQANVYMQSKSIEYIPKDNDFEGPLVQKSNVAFGLNGGFEFRLGNLYSIPLDICLITGKSEDNINSSWQLVEKTVYSFGISTGLSFNFGQTGRAIATDPGMQNGIPVSLDTTSRHPNADTSQVQADSITHMTIEPAPAVKTKEIEVPFYKRHISFAPVGCFMGRGKACLTYGESGLLFDLYNGNSAFLNYRYSTTKQTDLVADIHMWRSLDYVGIHGFEYSITVASLGFGIRKYPFTPYIHYAPYVQAIVNAQIETWDYSKRSELNWMYDSRYTTDIGFGAVLSTGIEIRLNQNYSLPIEAFYQFGKKAAAPGFYEGELDYDDHEKPRLSVFGIATGLSYNWMSDGNTSIRYDHANTSCRFDKYKVSVKLHNLTYCSADDRNYSNDSRQKNKLFGFGCEYSLTNRLSIFVNIDNWLRKQTFDSVSWHYSVDSYWLDVYQDQWLKDLSFDSKTWAIGGGLRYDLQISSYRLFPYFRGGVYWLSAKKEAWPGVDSLGHQLGFVKNSSGIGLSTGIGFDIRLNKYISFPIEARYMTAMAKVKSREHYETAWFYHDGYYYPTVCRDRNNEGYEDVSFFEVTMGIGFHFGLIK